MRHAALAALLVLSGLASAHAQEVAANCADPQTTLEVNECVSRDLDKADAELNTVYKRAMASQVDVDKNLAETNSALVGAAKALRAAQRAWIDFRDANCESKTYADADGTIRTAEEISCRTEMTTNRTKELKELTGEDN